MTKQEKTGLPIVAIVGRPNVGKSSFFNRLIHKRYAITSEIAGTTRDRIYFHAQLNNFTVVLVDTGGLEYGKKENIEANVQIQAQLAIQEADLIFFMIDAKEELTVEDHNAAKKLRKAEKKVILVANKIDHKEAINNIPETFKLGFGEAVEISAYHNINVGQVTDEAQEILQEQGWTPSSKEDQQEQKETMSVCFLGKPNVGKSSLVNALLGKEKVIVSDIPGTTRDAIDTEIIWKDQKFNLIDTAGLRRRGKIERGLEKLSSFRSLDAIERSDIICLIMDYNEGIRKQDQHICSYAQEAGKGIILVVNKVDLMEDREKDEKRMINVLRKKFDFLPWAPVIFISALRRKNIEKILELSQEIYKERFKRIDNQELNYFMKEITHRHMPPAYRNRLTLFSSMEQDAVNPPCFAYYVNEPAAIHFSYRRYLENQIREKYGFTGTAIRLYFKKRSSRKRDGKKKKR